MIVRSLINAVFPNIPDTMSLPQFIQFSGLQNSSGQVVNEETSKTLATAYRAFNVLSDDYAKMPLQTFISKQPGRIDRLVPDARMQNISWLLEVSPNRYMMPFIFKKVFSNGSPSARCRVYLETDQSLWISQRDVHSKPSNNLPGL